MQIPVTSVLYRLGCVSVFDLMLYGLCLNFLNSFFFFWKEGVSHLLTILCSNSFTYVTFFHGYKKTKI